MDGKSRYIVLGITKKPPASPGFPKPTGITGGSSIEGKSYETVLKRTKVDKEHNWKAYPEREGVVAGVSARETATGSVQPPYFQKRKRRTEIEEDKRGLPSSRLEEEGIGETLP